MEVSVRKKLLNLKIQVCQKVSLLKTKMNIILYQTYLESKFFLIFFFGHLLGAIGKYSRAN